MRVARPFDKLRTGQGRFHRVLGLDASAGREELVRSGGRPNPVEMMGKRHD
jgi:hypothetical protein